MTAQLTPAILDIFITKITAKTVFYSLTATGRKKRWAIPNVSTFDTSTLTIGKRYQVDSWVVLVRIRKPFTQAYTTAERYDWVTATELMPKAKLRALTAKQRQLAALLAALPLVDTEGMIVW